MKILMVCLGNICRSPLAEGIMRKHLTSLKWDGLIDSAGTINYHAGSPPDERSIKVASENGINISHLRGRQVKKDDFDNFDFIFAMDQSNFKDLASLAPPNQLQKLYLFLEFAGLGRQDVPDPYYGKRKQFEEVFDLLDKASILVSAKLLEKSTI